MAAAYPKSARAKCGCPPGPFARALYFCAPRRGRASVRRAVPPTSRVAKRPFRGGRIRAKVRRAGLTVRGWNGGFAERIRDEGLASVDRRGPRLDVRL